MSGPVGSMPLYKKLRLDAAPRALVLNQPRNYHRVLGDLPDGIELHFVPDGEYDQIQIFAGEILDLHNYLPIVRTGLVHDGILWIAYPKGSARVETDLSRDVLWGILDSYGYKAVTQIYFDDIWTVMRFRRKDLIGRK
jgi:hypothetical protein